MNVLIVHNLDEDPQYINGVVESMQAKFPDDHVFLDKPEGVRFDLLYFISAREGEDPDQHCKDEWVWGRQEGIFCCPLGRPKVRDE